MQAYLPGTCTLQILSSNITIPKLQKSYRYLMGSSLKNLTFNLYYGVLKYIKIGQSVSLQRWERKARDGILIIGFRLNQLCAPHVYLWEYDLAKQVLSVNPFGL